MAQATITRPATRTATSARPRTRAAITPQPPVQRVVEPLWTNEYPTTVADFAVLTGVVVPAPGTPSGDGGEGGWEPTGIPIDFGVESFIASQYM